MAEEAEAVDAADLVDADVVAEMVAEEDSVAVEGTCQIDFLKWPLFIAASLKKATVLTA